MSLSADGSRLAEGGTRNGRHTRVYEYNNGACAQIGADIEGKSTYDSFGRSVSLSADGTRLAASAPYRAGLNGI